MNAKKYGLHRVSANRIFMCVSRGDIIIMDEEVIVVTAEERREKAIEKIRANLVERNENYEGYFEGEEKLKKLSGNGEENFTI